MEAKEGNQETFKTDSDPFGYLFQFRKVLYPAGGGRPEYKGDGWYTMFQHEKPDEENWRMEEHASGAETSYKIRRVTPVELMPKTVDHPLGYVFQLDHRGEWRLSPTDCSDHDNVVRTRAIQPVEKNGGPTPEIPASGSGVVKEERQKRKRVVSVEVSGVPGDGGKISGDDLVKLEAEIQDAVARTVYESDTCSLEDVRVSVA